MYSQYILGSARGNKKNLFEFKQMSSVNPIIYMWFLVKATPKKKKKKMFTYITHQSILGLTG